jgi:type IV pilus assembly protein PilQ
MSPFSTVLWLQALCRACLCGVLGAGWLLPPLGAAAQAPDHRVPPTGTVQTPAPGGFTGEKISLNFLNIDIRSLLQVLADFSRFNVVTSEAVSGSLTLRLKDVPWDQALDIILQTKGLGMRQLGNVLWIATKEEMAAREKQDFAARAAIEALEPLQTRAFQLNYAKAAELALQIAPGSAATAAGAQAARILSVRGSVMAEPRTNQLFVTDIAARIEQVHALIQLLDIPIRQVLIEARIVEADDRFGRSLGVRLGGSHFGEVGGGNVRLRLGGSYSATDVLGNTAAYVNLPSTGLSGFSPAAFAVSLFDPSKTRFLNLEISALEADGRGKIVSSPRIVTADQVKALIEQGTEYPYQTATASGATAIAFRKAHLKLEVTPQITPEGGILLDVDINKDSRGETTAAGIAINTKHIPTQVLVEDGGTVVIGGIYETVKVEDVTQVPVLGDIPVMGHLFKNRRKSTNKSEMLVFLTPRVIADRGVRR